jgi:hypothetical protein
MLQAEKGVPKECEKGWEKVRKDWSTTSVQLMETGET